MSINTPVGFRPLIESGNYLSRVRMYFISDSVDFTDDAAVAANGELLAKTAGETDSNKRISEEGITLTRYFNKDTDFKIGDTVSNVLSVTFVNDDGALDSFDFTRRCKVYLDASDGTTWYNCPIGVFRFERPVKQKVQYIAATAYDIMQEYDVIADSWWNALDFTSGLTLKDIASAITTNLGMPPPAYYGSRLSNTSVTYTTRPFTATEMTYRDIIAKLAEAMATTARISENGLLSFCQFSTLSPSISVNCDAGYAFSFDVADYTVPAIDKLRVMAAESDYGAIIGSGTNGYEIVDNPFLYGATQQEVVDKATSIYNSLSSYQFRGYTPMSIRYTGDWSIGPGDRIKVICGGNTYQGVPIFQQTISWLGKRVYIDFFCTGNPSRPIMSQENRSEYRGNKTVHEVVVNSDSLMSRINDFNGSGSTIEQTVSGISTEVSSKVGDDEIISKINQSAEQITIQANKINLEGTVTANNGFAIDQNGYMTANGAALNGSMTSVSPNPNSPYKTVIENGCVKLYDESGVSRLELVAEQDGSEIWFSEVGGKKALIRPEGVMLHDPGLNTRVDISQSGIELFNSQGSSVFNADGDSYGTITSSGDAIIGNAINVGGNATIGENATIGGVLDVKNRRAAASSVSAGWHRVLEFAPDTASYRLGRAGIIVDLDITKFGTASETHHISLSLIETNARFYGENSNSNTQFIDKIRYAYDDSKGYVDIHLSSSSSVNVAVDYQVAASATSFFEQITTRSLADVADAPIGETVLTVYTFSANGTGDLNVNGTVTGQGFADLLFGVGSEIASNTDCDDLKTVGKYTCPSQAVGNTLSHAPFSSAFGMFAFRVASAERLVQLAMPNSDNLLISVRYYNGTSWTAWKTLTPS